MIYQLPNGKIIQITIEQYLDLTDEDIQYLVSINYGSYAKSPWDDSAIRKRRKEKSVEDEPHDKSIDYSDPDEDKSHGDNMPEDETFLDDIPDTSEEIEE